MEQRRCGKSELTLSALGLGCWPFGGGGYWGEQPQSETNRVVRRAYELGISYFDTAEAYNDGRSEAALGEALVGLPRSKIVIGTKLAPSNAYPDAMVKSCEASLKRLKTDYIDLYMLHWPLTPYALGHFTTDQKLIGAPPAADETLASLERLRRQGKIRHIGVSNFGPPRMQEFIDLGVTPAVNELPYCLLSRAIEGEILPLCRAQGVGVIAYMTLLQGLLADSFADFDAIPRWRKRTRHFSHTRTELCRHGQAGAEAEVLDALAGIRAIAKECGMTMAEVSIRWVLADAGVSSAVVSCRNLAQVEANVRAASRSLPAEMVERLKRVTGALARKLGPGFDYYENATHDRTL